MGTHPALACGANAWPPDFDDSATINIIDAGELRPVFNSLQGDGRYLARKDLNADTQINIIDVGALRPVFGKSCAP